MVIAAAFESIALGFSAALGGPYHPARVTWPGTPILDAGGSIATPGSPVTADCSVQVDVAGERMRAEAGFAEKDRAMLVIGLVPELTTDAVVTLLAGPDAGRWSVQSCERDPAGIGWVARGRRA